MGCTRLQGSFGEGCPRREQPPLGPGSNRVHAIGLSWGGYRFPPGPSHRTVQFPWWGCRLPWGEPDFLRDQDPPGALSWVFHDIFQNALRGSFCFIFEILIDWVHFTTDFFTTDFLSAFRQLPQGSSLPVMLRTLKKGVIDLQGWGIAASPECRAVE